MTFFLEKVSNYFGIFKFLIENVFFHSTSKSGFAIVKIDNSFRVLFEFVCEKSLSALDFLIFYFENLNSTHWVVFGVKR